MQRYVVHRLQLGHQPWLLLPQLQHGLQDVKRWLRLNGELLNVDTVQVLLLLH